MLQSCNTIKGRYDCLHMMCGVLINDEIICSSSDTNGFWSVNIRNNNICYICDDAVSYVTDSELYTIAIQCENKIFFIPGRSEFITVLDLVTRKVKNVKIETGESVGGNQFDYGIEYKGFIYLFPRCAKTASIYKLDCSSYKILKVNDGYNVKTNGIEWPDKYFAGDVCDNIVYLASAIDGTVVEFDLETESIIKTISIGNDNYPIKSLKKRGDKLFIIDINGNLYEYSMKNHLLRNIWTNNDKGILYERIILCNEMVMLVPLNSCNFVIVNTNDFSSKRLTFVDDVRWWLRWNSNRAVFLNNIEDDKSIFLLNSSVDEYLKIDKNDLSISNRELSIPNDISKSLENAAQKKLFKERMMTQYTLHEEYSFDLKQYIMSSK